MSKTSPVGTSASKALERDLKNREFRQEWERLWPFEMIARKVIVRRAELGLSQKELAQRVGTSHSAISRIESGQHPTSVQTLIRLAEALELELVVDFKKKSAKSKMRRKIAA